MDGTRQVNNPSRVPSTLTAIDGPQEGALRVIHPVALLVGTTQQETSMTPYGSDAPYFEVPEDGVYTDDRGNPIAFKAGDKLTLSRAATFKDFNVSTEGSHLSGLSPARMDAAPENRMDPARENRTAKSTKKSGE